MLNKELLQRNTEGPSAHKQTDILHTNTNPLQTSTESTHRELLSEQRSHNNNIPPPGTIDNNVRILYEDYEAVYYALLSTSNKH